MKVRFYTFSKRLKSTKQPSTGYTEKELYLKEACSMLNPRFVCQGFNPSAYNYFYVPDWNMYFFRTSLTYEDGMYIIGGEIDVYATTKSYIQASTAFVSYSSTDYSVYLTDPRVAKLNKMNVLKSSDYNTIFGSTNYDYLWVAGTNGTVCYRCNVKNVTSAIYNAANQDLLDNLCQTWADIQSCILYARSYSLDTQSGGTSESVVIGKYDTGVNGVRLSDSQLLKVFDTAISIPIPHTYTDFRRFAFSKMKLSLPFIGVVELAISDFVEDPAAEYNINIKYTLNLGSGVVTYIVSNDDGAIIGSYSGVAGRARPVTLYSPFNGQGVLTSAGATIAGGAGVVLATGPVGIAAGIGAAIAGFAGMISATEESSGSAIGTNDGSAEEKINYYISLSVEEYDSNIDPSNLTVKVGRPCGKVRSLSGLTGYVQTEGFQLEAPYDSLVLAQVNEGLNSGIYIE